METLNYSYNYYIEAGNEIKKIKIRKILTYKNMLLRYAAVRKK